MATPERIVAPNRFIQVSTDARPIEGSGRQVPPGSTVYDYDTGNMWITYNGGSNWNIKGDVVDSKIKTITGSLSARGLGAYSANDVISNATASGTTHAFAAVARQNGGSGYITQAIIHLGTSGITSTRLDLDLYTALPVGAQLNDNAANLSPAGTDVANYVGSIQWLAVERRGSGQDTAIATPSTYGNLPLGFVCASGADDLYGVLITRDSTTIGTNVTTRIDLTVEQL